MVSRKKGHAQANHDDGRPCVWNGVDSQIMIVARRGCGVGRQSAFPSLDVNQHTLLHAEEDCNQAPLLYR